MNIEWIRIIIDYLSVSNNKEKNMEIIFPIIISIVASVSYYIYKDVVSTLKIFTEQLLNITSVLIGFTGILVTLFLTTENKNIKSLREKETEKFLYGKKVTLFDLLHILFTYALLNELILLLILLFNQYIRGLFYSKTISFAGLFLEIFMILNIIFSMMRGVNNLYWIFKKR